MWQSLKRWWKYLAVKLRVAHAEHADPKVQLEQAILEAHAEHRKLSDAAALVVAQQKQAQDRLDAKVEECDKAKASAGQALLMIDREARLGHSDKVATFTTAAEGLANRVLGFEREVRELDQALLQATRSSEQAKAAVVQNATTLQSKLDEQERLLSVLDRAKMQEALNDARGQLDDVLGDDVPTFAEVERKILNRHAVAEAKGELTALQAERAGRPRPARDRGGATERRSPGPPRADARAARAAGAGGRPGAGLAPNDRTVNCSGGGCTVQTIDTTSPTVGTVPSRPSTPRATAGATPCTCRPSCVPPRRSVRGFTADSSPVRSTPAPLSRPADPAPGCERSADVNGAPKVEMVGDRSVDVADRPDLQ